MDTILDAEESQEGDEDDSHVGDEADQSNIPAVPLQFATNTIILQHPWLQFSDIHCIQLSMDPQNIPTTSYKNSGLNGRAEGCEELFIINTVPETNSDMIWWEFYMYEVVLKQCSKDLSAVGSLSALRMSGINYNLEKMYGLGWSEVKRSTMLKMPCILYSASLPLQWLQHLQAEIVELVNQLHSLGILHVDLEPQNVAQTHGGFKFFDFRRSELHYCQYKECDELQNLLSV
ncbi:hypothetical protein DFS33DRAFT_1449207 [Desarmillaria ectypa]|nr:hypothetical protein DFS33DRAFT_1449207 [Desarmillaria ectypa]